MDNNRQQSSISTFVTDPYVRSSWIAFFTLWVLWGLVYFLRHAFGNDYANHTTTTTKTGTAAAPAVQDPETTVGGGVPGDATATTATKQPRWRGADTSLRDRLRRTHEVLLENTLLLLSVLTLNTFGSGSTRAVMILAWIFFAFTVINAFTEVGIHHHFIRLVFNIVFYGVTLAIGGLAFSQGWHTVGSVF
ncbi:hypothetical protein INT46_007885 [Mucor plumbeus]|jgi:hypothetical protein|uniref:Uncharacterized protein n=1 Tax=Mucor plumbeus TaxID=97098 RepID=A0A8H7QJ07_9FUNG|nr:hypothetical protein INT46_007885 [Mucor plumbeus]